MSKRSYRRLAVVAGAALAVGSMAPAMAAQVNAGGNGSATVDVSDVTIPSASTLIPTAYIGSVKTFALGNVFGAQNLALGTVGGLKNDVTAIATGLLGATSNLSLNVQANANASNGGAAVQVGGVATGASDLLELVPDPGIAVSGVHSNLTPLAGYGLNTAGQAVSLAGAAPGVVLGTAGSLVGSAVQAANGLSVSANAVADLLATY